MGSTKLDLMINIHFLATKKVLTLFLLLGPKQ